MSDCHRTLDRMIIGIPGHRKTRCRYHMSPARSNGQLGLVERMSRCEMRDGITYCFRTTESGIANRVPTRGATARARPNPLLQPRLTLGLESIWIFGCERSRNQRFDQKSCERAEPPHGGKSGDERDSMRPSPTELSMAGRGPSRHFKSRVC